MRIEIEVNGHRHALDVDPAQSLLSVLRDDLGLTGTKYGCGEGQCGACTVLLGQTAVHACMTPVSAGVGSAVTTIEGLERNGRLHPLQQAFIDEGALQCGYCTPGMIMAGVALLRTSPSPSPNEIARALQGNICRCGTHSRIVSAVQRAAAAAPGGAQVDTGREEGRT
ncbi:MAG TPA: (2Fe-2S)-binding protein [Gemmatimonadaceae bacterium]|jgi:aerobic-type carbon monoxide dehydrogenase small subunit (CoxS/CutS family)